MPRFFVRNEDINGTNVLIRGQDLKHIVTVLRYSVGSVLEVCDGCGIEYLAKINSITSDIIKGTLVSKRSSHSEPKIDVTLYQALPKGDKFDDIIQRSVELGVKKIVPVLSSRTIVKFNDLKDIEKKRARWLKVAEAAAKQSGRGIIPCVEFPKRLDEALLDRGDSIGLIAYEDERMNNIKDTITSKKPDAISILIGPEGGWAKSEFNSALEHGWLSVTLGPRILRTETVSLAVLSGVMFLMGEMGWINPIEEEWHSIL